MKILVAVDGFQDAERAVDYVISFAQQLKKPAEIFLLNVQENKRLGGAEKLIAEETLIEQYQQAGMQALDAARKKLEAAELPYTFHISVGVPAQAILQYLQTHQIEQIVLGYRKIEKLRDLVFGSVAREVLKSAQIPVILLKQEDRIAEESSD